MERRFVIMLGQKVARTTIGAIRAVAGSKKIQNGIVAPCKQNIGPTLSIIKNTTLKKSRECASNAQAFYQQKVEPKVQKAKNTVVAKSKEYPHEFLNSTAVHGSVEAASKFVPPQYKSVFTTITPPILHITTKVIGEILPSQKSNTDKTQHTTEKQKEKKKESIISKKITDELAATAITKTALSCTKGLTKNLSPVPKFIVATGTCAASHLAMKDIGKIIGR